MSKFDKEQILRTSGVNVLKCMRCGKCSATCPSYDEMEYHPHQFVYMVEKGEIDKLMNSPSIYKCLSCFACVERCPRSVEPAALIEAVRDAVVRLLSDEGRFAVVLPADEAARFIGICRDVLLPVRRTDVRTTPRHAAKRVLLEFVHTSSAPAPDRTELVIGTGVHEQYTPEYRALTRDFYLKF